jgi:TonB-dependent SusC/RagA subfamily outer membrane receptor
MKTKFTMILTLFMALIVQITFAQQQTVSGTVSDENGLPLIGATVVISGTSSGTTTDFDGNYRINARQGEVLNFSYVGYQSQNITVGTSNTVNVSLQLDNSLEEVVVTGYTSQKRTDVTGAIAQVNAEEITSVITSTVDQALQGSVSGLAITSNSGTPGSTSQIRIRGISSITAGNEPLYVIDGVPIDNSNVSTSTATSFFSSLTGLDSNNIESMTILKDASATSQYGSRGANGVILITTKSGKSGKTKYTFNNSFGFQNDAVEGPNPLTAANRLELYSEALFNDGNYSSKSEAETALLSGSF